MAEVATAHLLLLENSRETSTEKTTEEREEKEGAHNQKTGPTPFPRELERDARAWKNRQGKGGLRGTLAFGLWHRFVSAQTLWAFDHAGSCLALRTLTSLGLV